jgi:hypothetical protein
MKKFSVKLSDLLLASLILFSSLAFANAEITKVESVPFWINSSTQNTNVLNVVKSTTSSITIQAVPLNTFFGNTSSNNAVVSNVQTSKELEAYNRMIVTGTSLKTVYKAKKTSYKINVNRNLNNIKNANVYDKAGNIIVDAVGAPKVVSFGIPTNVKQNLNSEINKIIKTGAEAMNKATVTATTVKVNTFSPFTKISNFFNNLWTNYKANFVNKTMVK